MCSFLCAKLSHEQYIDYVNYSYTLKVSFWVLIIKKYKTPFFCFSPSQSEIISYHFLERKGLMHVLVSLKCMHVYNQLHGWCWPRRRAFYWIVMVPTCSTLVLPYYSCFINLFIGEDSLDFDVTNSILHLVFIEKRNAIWTIKNFSQFPLVSSSKALSKVQVFIND